MVVLRGIVVWLVLIFAETQHGTARGILLKPHVGDLRARQIGVFTGSIIFFAVALAFVRWIGANRASQLFGVGVLWVGLTAAFEVSFGRFVLGYSWERIRSDYDLSKGGLLPIGLVLLALSPYIAGKVRGNVDTSKSEFPRRTFSAARE
jgi:hypothetical protein